MAENSKLCLGVLTSGGDAPGMNNAVRAVVKTALAKGLDTYLIYQGYYGLVHNLIELATPKNIEKILNRGGSILASARLPEFKDLKVRQQAVENLKKHHISYLVTIGGDGTYMGAKLLSELGINCIGIPGTIDNNLAYTDFTLGYDTALNTIVHDLDNIRDTMSAHHRCAIVEVMGRDCGDLAYFSGLACGADVICTPEFKLSPTAVGEAVKTAKQQNKDHCLVVVTEHLYPDLTALAKTVAEISGMETKTVVLGHVQRGGTPSANDRILGTLCGVRAVELLLAKKTNRCIGIKNNQICDFAIDEILNLPYPSRKDIYQDWQLTI